MAYFIALRNGPNCRAGEWFEGEPGEELFRGELIRQGRAKWGFRQTSRVGIPFRLLAPYIVERGFSVPRSTLNEVARRLGAIEQQAKVDEFIERNSDIIEPELEARNKRANPTYSESWGEMSKDKIRRDIEKESD